MEIKSLEQLQSFRRLFKGDELFQLMEKAFHEGKYVFIFENFGDSIEFDMMMAGCDNVTGVWEYDKNYSEFQDEKNEACCWIGSRRMARSGFLF